MIPLGIAVEDRLLEEKRVRFIGTSAKGSGDTDILTTAANKPQRNAGRTSTYWRTHQGLKETS